jgi:hypothetical protein
VRRFFEKYDYFILPTAQLFPFDVNIHWPQDVSGRKMETYHEWMKGVLPITMSGCPALAAPAGFNEQGLPIGIQIVGPTISVEFTVTLLKDETGKLVGMAAVMRDVTKQFQEMRALRQKLDERSDVPSA